MLHEVLVASKVPAQREERLWKSEPEKIKIPSFLQPNAGVAAVIVLSSGNGLFDRYRDAPFWREMGG